MFSLQHQRVIDKIDIIIQQYLPNIDVDGSSFQLYAFNS